MKMHLRCETIDTIKTGSIVTACGRCLHPDDMTPAPELVTCKRCIGTDIYQRLQRCITLAASAGHDSIDHLTQSRGKEYGKPIDHFNASQQMYEIWRARAHASGPLSVMDIEQQNAVHHGVRFIIDKLVRAAESPTKKDHWDDIQGYARCVIDALDLDNAEAGQ